MDTSKIYYADEKILLLQDNTLTAEAIEDRIDKERLDKESI